MATEDEYREECGNCRYSHPVEDERGDFSYCRFDPPRLEVGDYKIDGERFLSNAPIVFNDWWCGKWFKGVGRG